MQEASDVSNICIRDTHNLQSFSADVERMNINDVLNIVLVGNAPEISKMFQYLNSYLATVSRSENDEAIGNETKFVKEKNDLAEIVRRETLERDPRKEGSKSNKINNIEAKLNNINSAFSVRNETNNEENVLPHSEFFLKIKGSYDDVAKVKVDTTGKSENQKESSNWIGNYAEQNRRNKSEANVEDTLEELLQHEEITSVILSVQKVSKSYVIKIITFKKYSLIIRECIDYLRECKTCIGRTIESLPFIAKSPDDTKPTRPEIELTKMREYLCRYNAGFSDVLRHVTRFTLAVDHSVKLFQSSGYHSNVSSLFQQEGINRSSEVASKCSFLKYMETMTRKNSWKDLLKSRKYYNISVSTFLHLA